MSPQRSRRSHDAPRSFIPRCLQHRAPAKYEILDAKNRRVPPTLAGYRLRPGAEYRLRVETQDGNPHGWRLQLTPPPRFIDWPSGDSQQDSGRVLVIRTRAYLQDNLLQVFRNPADGLAVKVEFDDGRQPYSFRIPVVLANRWWYVPFLIGGPLLSLLPKSLPNEWRLGFAIAGLIGAMFLCWFWDLARSYRRAKKMIAKLKRKELEQTAPKT